MTDETNTTARLDACFAAAREAMPAPPATLLARIAEDARTVQGARQVNMSPPRQRRTALHHILQALGGWPALGGLATATVAGIWLGVNPPASVELAAQSYLGLDRAVYLLDFGPDAGFDLSEDTL